MNSSPRVGKNHSGSACAVSSIGLEALFTTIETGSSGLYCSIQNALTHAGEASSNVMVSDRGDGPLPLPVFPWERSAGLRGGKVIELITSPALSPALAAGEPGLTDTMWVVTG